MKHNLLYGTRIVNNHLEQNYLPLILLIILSITDDISEKSFVLLGMTESWKNPIKTLPLAVIREASDSGLVHLAPRNNINCSIVILNIFAEKMTQNSRGSGKNSRAAAAAALTIIRNPRAHFLEASLLTS